MNCGPLYPVLVGRASASEFSNVDGDVGDGEVAFKEACIGAAVDVEVMGEGVAMDALSVSSEAEV